MSLEWILLGLRVLATAILYTFLGVAFYLIWHELKQAASQVVTQPEVINRLRVMTAAEGQSFVAGQVLPLRLVTLIGRNSENTIVVPDEAISDRHACLYRKNGTWWLEDLGSKNGTKLNKLPLSKSTPLTHGDLIEIGNLCFRLEIIPEEQITA